MTKLKISAKAYEELKAERDQLQQERDGYKNAYEIISERYYTMRSVVAPLVREKVPDDAADRPSIFLVTLPKSGTVFISHSLKQSLVYDYTSTLVTPTFPKNQIWDTMADDFGKGAMVSASHLQPDDTNIAALQRHGISKAVIHIRDPRAALSSWFHFRKSYAANFKGNSEIGQVVLPVGETFAALSMEQQMDHFIDTFYVPAVEWIRGWLHHIPNSDFLLKTHEELLESEPGYLQSVLQYYGISGDVAPVQRNKSTHFRKGDNTSWQEELTPAQLERVNALLPDEWIDRFGWVGR